MLKNYYRVILGICKKYPGYTMINILGLAVGLACTILISLWVRDELNFDKFHENAENIYRICVEGDFGSPFTLPIFMAPAAKAMTEDFPEILYAARLSKPSRASLKFGTQPYSEDLVAFADNSFFSVFSFPIIRGDEKKPLVKPYSLVVTASTARKYFGSQNPIGKSFQFGGRNDYTITAVCEDAPDDSHFKFNMLCSMKTLEVQDPQVMNYWLNIQYFTYLKTVPGTKIHLLQEKMPGFIEKHMGDLLASSGGKISTFFQPLTSIHLHSDLSGELQANGNMKQICTFAGIALFILITACVNFVNLTTARSSIRSREVGLRKTMGATRRGLFTQFMGESVLFSMGSAVLSIIIVEMILPWFNEFTGKNLELRYFGSDSVLGLLLITAVLVGLVSGLYPAGYLSRFDPVNIYSGSSGRPRGGLVVRRILVGCQFLISIALITGTLTIILQLNYLREYDLGYHPENVMVIPQANLSGRHGIHTMRDQLGQIPGIIDVTACSRVPGAGYRLAITIPEGRFETQPFMMNIESVDSKYLPVFGIQLIKGRNFDSAVQTDVMESVIINETACRNLGWTDPLGKMIRNTVRADTGFIELNRKVIGVVKDYHQRDLHHPLEPVLIGNDFGNQTALAVKLDQSEIKTASDELERVWRELEPDRPFNRFFLDQTVSQAYLQEEKLMQIIGIFSFLAILISSLGITGLSHFSAERRCREMGIRRVMGARLRTILRIMACESLLLSGVAGLAAGMVMQPVMSSWLQNFANHIHIPLAVFVVPVILAAAVAGMIALFMVYKISRQNPADILRYE